MSISDASGSPAPATAARSFSDLTVRQAVESELAWTPDVTAPTIGVSVDGGVVTLTGEVASLHERIAAVEAVQRIAGVRTVADELRLPDAGRRAQRPTARRGGRRSPRLDGWGAE